MKTEAPERYLANAKETLAKAGIEGDRYLDMKYVKSACGIAYLGVLTAIDEYLLKHGVDKDKLPEKVEEYQKALTKHSVHNGKMLGQFNALYHELHIAGYYKGHLQHVEVIKAIMKSARDFVHKLGGKDKT
jgi:Domain of unknown function (DUF5618)